MEIDILNELLTESVAKLFNPRQSYQFRQPEPKQPQYSVSPSNNTSISSIQSQPQPLTSLDQWTNVVGPQKLQDSLQKLNIDLQKLTRRELEAMSSQQLEKEKKRVKNELKAYDATFQTLFNRFPQRNEKEPMRPLYIYYKKLKQQLEKAPVSKQPVSSQVDLLKKIEDLKKQRAELREKLNAFQNEFTQTHNRRIRFHKDIAPVEREYKLYKEIKQEVQRLEGIIGM